MTRHQFRGSSTIAVLKRAGAVAVTVAGVSILPAIASGAHTKALSLTNVTISGSENNAFFAPVWIAIKKGFFAQQGIRNVTIANISSSGADAVAALLGGSAQFVNANASASGLAIQSGAPVRTVFADNYGTETELALNTGTLSARGIPLTGSTPAEAKAQILALKGSHLTIAFPNSSGDPYTNFISLTKVYGLTVGPGGDVNVTFTGSATASVSGFNAGKFDGFGSQPPNTVQPNSSVIAMGLIPPVSKGIDNLISTTTAMIGSHSDTVQAFVTAVTEGYNTVVNHPVAGEQVLSSLFTQFGINSPEEQQYLFAHYQATARPSPAVTRAAFNSQKLIFDLAEPTVFNVPFGSWFDNKYVDNAIRTLKYRFPTAP